VQGQLRGEPLSVVVRTECAHCASPLHLEIDSELNVHVVEEGADPVLFVPMVDLHALEEPSIIDAF
jgi:hypothetical protein